MQNYAYLKDSEVSNILNLSQISSLMLKIEQTTSIMNSTFQQSILKHQEQFIKAYKIKIYELTKLFHQLKRNIEDKFINNAINQQLQTVIKERDYFKYECLKLNTQYKNVLDDYKNVTEQTVNVTQQMDIYKHLLENQKIKNSEIQKNAKKLKNNLIELASKTVQEAHLLEESRSPQRSLDDEKEQITHLKKQIKQKSQTIRALKAKIQQFDQFAEKKYTKKQQKKQLQEIFRCCVQNWKRQILSKSRKFSSGKHSSPNLMSMGNVKSTILNFNSCSVEQFTNLQKKQLLQMLFTHPLFLEFVEKLLFDTTFEVHFIQAADIIDKKKDQIFVRNRTKLYDLMKKKGLINGVMNKPCKFR